MLFDLPQLLKKYNLKPSGVLHVGASSGQERTIYHKCGLDNVLWIEAIPSVFNELKENIKPYPQMFCINVCVADKDGQEITFNVANNEGQSSSILELAEHKNEHPEVHYVSQLKMKTRRLDTILMSIHKSVADYDFLNFDLQGAELMALKGLGAEIHKAKAIYCEVNKAELYKGCPIIDDIDAYLADAGFKRVETQWCGNFSWGDALYLKNV